MRGDAQVWEGVAAGLLEAIGAEDPPQDARELAVCCGLALRPSRAATASYDPALQLIRYPVKARPQRQQGLIAHELGHWALDWADEPDSEQGANYVAGALMLPRRAFDRDLTETEWDLEQLRAKHTNCSAEMIARRLVELRDAVATIWDHGRVKARVASPWLGDTFARVTQVERDLADAALGEERVQRGDGLLWAWPLIDGLHRRVVVVAEAEQLSLLL